MWAYADRFNYHIADGKVNSFQSRTSLDRLGSDDGHQKLGLEKTTPTSSVPTGVGGGRQDHEHQRKESAGGRESDGVAGGSGHPHPDKKKPMTKAERRALQVCVPLCVCV